MTQLFPILIEDSILVPALLYAIFYRSFAKNHHTGYLRMSLSSPPIRRQYKIRLRKLVFPRREQDFGATDGDRGVPAAVLEEEHSA